MELLDRLKSVVLLRGGVHKEIGSGSIIKSAAVVYATWLIFSFPTILKTPNYLAFVLFAGCVFWIVSAGTFHFLSWVLAGKGDYWAYVRSVGYCHAPMALGIFPLLAPVGILWSLLCLVVATRENYGLSNFKSCLVVFLPFAAVMLFVLSFAALVSLNAPVFLQNASLNTSYGGY